MKVKYQLLINQPCLKPPWNGTATTVKTKLTILKNSNLCFETFNRKLINCLVELKNCIRFYYPFLEENKQTPKCIQKLFLTC